MVQAETFRDTQTGETFVSSQYSVRNNPSGATVLTTKAPSGVMAVKMIHGDVELDDEMPTPYELGTTTDEVSDTMEILSEREGISVNPEPSRVGQALGALPGGIGKLSWQSLRLPGVAYGQRVGIMSAAAKYLKALGIDRGTFRQGPFANLITAKMWTDYINNIEMTDVGAELSSEVSPEEKLSIFMFCKEWEDDPSHIAFRKRLQNTPDVNAADEIAKGNIVYDLMTGSIPGPGLPANIAAIKHDKMYRLAADIIHSMRLNHYNFYSLNLVHAHEGTAVYDEFMNNYVALEPEEVQLVQEIAAGISSQGRGYAFSTIMENGDPLGAYDLMQRAVHYYNSGDTRMVRTIFDTLFAAPFNYKPHQGYMGMFDPMDSRFSGHTQPLHLKIGGQFRWIMPHPNLKEGKDGKPSIPDKKGQQQFIEVLSQSYAKPITVWTKKAKKGWDSMPFEQFEMFTKQAAAFQSREDSDSRTAEQVRRGQQRMTAYRTGDDKKKSGRKKGETPRGGGRGGSGGSGGGDRRGSGSSGSVNERQLRALRGKYEDAGQEYPGDAAFPTWDDANKAFEAFDNPPTSVTWEDNPVRSNMAFQAPELRQASSAKAKKEMMTAFTVKYLDPTWKPQVEKGEQADTTMVNNPNRNKKSWREAHPQAAFSADAFYDAKRLALAYDPSAMSAYKAAKVLEGVLTEAYGSQVSVNYIHPSKNMRNREYFRLFMDPNVPAINPGRWGAQVPLGRGFQYHIYIHPKTQMKLSMGKGGRDEAKKHGDTGSIPRNLPLLKKLLGKKGYAMYGVHKKTGTKEPYNIKLPAKLFTAITLDASQSPSGKPIRTIMPFKQKSQKKTSQIHKAWQQFLEVYGYPIVDARRGDPVAYRIAKGGRGPYYEGMRLKKGRKK